MSESPWGALHDRQGVDQRDLARRLKPYGIVPRSIRLDAENVPRGYLREQFVDAWKRYLRLDEPPEPSGTSQDSTNDQSPLADLIDGLDAFWLGSERQSPSANGHARARVVGVNSHFELIGEDGRQLTTQPFVGPLQAASYAKRQGWEVIES